MFQITTLAIFSIGCFLSCLPASAQTISGNAAKGTRVIAVSNGSALNNKASGSKFSFTPSSKQTVRLIVQNTSTGKVVGPVVEGLKSKKTVVTFADGKKLGIYKKNGATAVVGFKVASGQKINVGKLKAYSKGESKTYYVKALTAKRNTVTTATSAVTNTGLLGTTGKFGLGSSQNTSSHKQLVGAKSDSDDSDGDGLPDIVDIDDDNDGILDSYESLATIDPAGAQLFSNLKVPIETSLNINANPNITQDQINSLVKDNLTLALPISSDGVNSTSELDCTGLSYCGSGGSAVPLQGSGTFPGDFDADGDGFGTISSGQSNDFQMRPNVNPSEIGSGDILTEIVTDTDGNETRYTKILNFVFNTTPAIQTVSIKDGSNSVYTSSPYTITYPVSPGQPGTTQSCFQAPPSGTVKVDINAWRPQRPGISAAGEGAYVDIGQSLITIDIPNSPCVTSGNAGCSGNGVGNCRVSAYSTTDSNITSDANGLKDNLSDATAEPLNSFSFTIDLTDCLLANSTAWNSGESLFVDLQMRNSAGDNAAQKFCVKRD